MNVQDRNGATVSSWRRNVRSVKSFIEKKSEGESRKKDSSRQPITPANDFFVNGNKQCVLVIVMNACESEYSLSLFAVPKAGQEQTQVHLFYS